jgi:type IV pilus assembly protein PilN
MQNTPTGAKPVQGMGGRSGLSQAGKGGVLPDAKQQNIHVEIPKKQYFSDSTKQAFYSFFKKATGFNRSVIGLEILPNIIRICEAEDQNGKWKIKRIDSVKIGENSSYENLKKSKGEYAEAIKNLFKKNKIKNQNVAISIPTMNSIIKTVSLPLMSDKDLQKATKVNYFWQNLVQLSENINDYSIFFRVISRDELAKKMDILFVASKKEDINNYAEIVEKAGLKPFIVDVSCFSLSNFSDKIGEGNAAEISAMLKVGSDENYIQIIENQKPYIYDIFIPESEKLYISEYIDHQSFQQRYISQIKHILSKHKEATNTDVKKIDVIAGIENTHHLIEVLKEKVEGVGFEELNFIEKFGISLESQRQFGKKLKSESNISSWSIVIGLAARKIDIFFEGTKTNIADKVNLATNFNELIRGVEAVFVKKFVLGILFFIGMSCVSISVYTYSTKYNDYLIKMAHFNSLKEEYTKLKKELEGTSKKARLLNNIAKEKENIISNQPVPISFLNVVAEHLPKGVWLEKIEFNIDDKFSITGKAFNETSIHSYLKKLSENSRVVKISLDNMKTEYLKNGAPIKQFIASGTLFIESDIVKKSHLEEMKKKKLEEAKNAAKKSKAKKQ